MRKGYAIKVENSAPSQTRPARAVVWAAPILFDLGVRAVVDLGCGRLRNLPVLEKYFSRLALVDTEAQCHRVRDMVPKRASLKFLSLGDFEKRKGQYGAVFLISVLHIVDKPSERRRLLRVVAKSLKPSGFLVIDVPSGEHYYRARCSPENRHGDGWVMGAGPFRTFYKSYSPKALDKLVRDVGFFELHEAKAFDKHIVRIWRKR